MFVECRQRCRWYIDGVRVVEEKDAFVFGSFFHWLIENMLAAIATKTAQPKFSLLERQWRKSNDAAQVKDPQMLEQHVAMAMALFDPYRDLWMKDDKKRKWVAVEGVFDTPFQGWRTRGKRDAVFRTRKGDLWLLETKTTSRIDDRTLTEKLNFDPQNLFYLTALETDMKEKVKGVVYNVIRKPQLRRGQDETVKSFGLRMRDAVEADPDAYFARYDVPYSRATIRQFQEELGAKLREFHAWCRGELPTYKNESACIKRWTCEYLRACGQRGTAGYRTDGTLFSELEE